MKMETQMRAKNVKLWKILNAVCVLGTVVSLAIGIIGSLLLYTYTKMGTVNYKPLDYAKVTASDDDIEDLLTKNTVLNICLFGLDRRDKSDTKSRSDSTMLFSINNSLKKIKLVSFMRDIYTSIPGHRPNRLNVAIACGGESLAIRTLQNLFGVKVDKYVTIDFDGFKDVINILGGIELKLSAKEAAYINGDLKYFRSKSQLLPEKDGTYLLDGEKTLSYSRARKIPTPEGLHDDFARTYRQRIVITTIMDKLRSCDLNQVRKIINRIGPYIVTDFKKSDILQMAKNFAKYSKYTLEQFRLPTDDNYNSKNIDGMAVLTIPDKRKAQYDLAKFLYEKDLKVKVKTGATA